MMTSVWCSVGMWMAWVRLGMSLVGAMGMGGGSGGVEVKIE